METMELWSFLYLLSTVVNIAVAYFFYKSKNGWTRKYLIMVFLSTAWMMFTRSIYGCLLFNGIVFLNAGTVSLVAIIPHLITSVLFLHYLLKEHKKR